MPRRTTTPELPHPNVALSPEVLRYCEEKAVKLTPLREKILSIIMQTTQPMTAYVILEALQADKPKAQVMSVYRILDFLLENGLVHRIENLNAFMPCYHLFENHQSQWLICKQCGRTDESALPIFNQAIAEIEAQTDFTVTSPTIELVGLCNTCQNTEQP